MRTDSDDHPTLLFERVGPAPWDEPVPAQRPRRSVWVVAAVAATVGLGTSAAVFEPWDRSGATRATGTIPDRGAPAGPPTPEVPSGVGDVEHLEPKVRSAVRRAIAAARADGVELRVTSGWRSKKHQERLYDAAIAKYGTPEKARRWVLPPDESAHVLGGAVDVGPEEGAAWLRANGERFGLCQRYANEPWHFERLAGAKGSSCPALEPHP